MRAKEEILNVFPGMQFTDAIMTEDEEYVGFPFYSNMLAKGETTLSETETNIRLKEIEKQLEDTQFLREQNIVMMDIDL